MRARPAPILSRTRFLARALCAFGLLMLPGCAQGDFGRVRPSLVRDDIHDWLGRKAARAAGHRPSSAALTDDERRLRDLAYPLIEPPFDRGRWDSVLLEYGIQPNSAEMRWPLNDHKAYGARLMDRPYRSAAARYSQLIDDIRNDIVRIRPFFDAARRVLDIDAKRAKGLAYVSGLTAAEHADARRRMRENALIVAWVQHSLKERADAFNYALERMVIATPFPMAADAERTLMQLKQYISANRLVALRQAMRSTALAAVMPMLPVRCIHCTSQHTLRL